MEFVYKNTIAEANLYGARHYPQGYTVHCDFAHHKYYAVPNIKKEDLPDIKIDTIQKG